MRSTVQATTCQYGNHNEYLQFAFKTDAPMPLLLLAMPATVLLLPRGLMFATVLMLVEMSHSIVIKVKAAEILKTRPKC